MTPIPAKSVPRKRICNATFPRDAPTNCGRKAKKKSAVFGFRILTIMPCPKTRLSLTRGASGERSRDKLSRVFGQGIIVNILNPKTALFFFAFLPQFVDASRGSVALQILVLGTLFAVMGITSDSLWALFAGSVALRLNRNSHWNRT